MSESLEHYYQSPHWKDTRKRKRKALQDGRRYLCEKCGDYFRLQYMHTHHLHYKSLGREDTADLKLLCLWCHAEVHGKRPKCSIPREVALLLDVHPQSDGEANQVRQRIMQELEGIDDESEAI